MRCYIYGGKWIVSNVRWLWCYVVLNIPFWCVETLSQWQIWHMVLARQCQAATVFTGHSSDLRTFAFWPLIWGWCDFLTPYQSVNQSSWIQSWKKYQVIINDRPRSICQHRLQVHVAMLAMTHVWCSRMIPDVVSSSNSVLQNGLQLTPTKGQHLSTCLEIHAFPMPIRPIKALTLDTLSKSTTCLKL